MCMIRKLWSQKTNYIMNNPKHPPKLKSYHSAPSTMSNQSKTQQQHQQHTMNSPNPSQYPITQQAPSPLTKAPSLPAPSSASHEAEAKKDPEK